MFHIDKRTWTANPNPFLILQRMQLIINVLFKNLSCRYEKSSKKGEKILRESDQILKNLLISLIFYLLQSLQSFFVISRSPVQVLFNFFSDLLINARKRVILYVDRKF